VDSLPFSFDRLSEQDELGRLLLAVCRTVPHGVLCFLPSYSLLEKLITRWNSTGLAEHIGHYKTIVCESRESSAFEETLRSFYDAIKASERCAMSTEFLPSFSFESNEHWKPRSTSILLSFIHVSIG